MRLSAEADKTPAMRRVKLDFVPADDFFRCPMPDARCPMPDVPDVPGMRRPARACPRQQAGFQHEKSTLRRQRLHIQLSIQ